MTSYGQELRSPKRLDRTATSTTGGRLRNRFAVFQYSFEPPSFNLVDLNPIRATIAETIETSDYTSAQRRVQALQLTQRFPDFPIWPVGTKTAFPAAVYC